MNFWSRCWRLLVPFMAVWLLAANAGAAVPLCVTVRAASADQSGIDKLVRSEVARHPSHRMVERDCESHLIVEVFEAVRVKYLTVQLDGEVPVRHELEGEKALASKLRGAVTAVLGSDPVALSEDPARFGAMERMGHSVLVRGVNAYRLELFETLMRTDQNVAFAPGLALGFARGAEHWRIQARAHFAGWSGTVRGEQRALRLAAGLDGGVIYEASRRATTTGYVGAGAGLVFLRLEGLAVPSDRQSSIVVDRMGATLNLRVGVRALTIFDFDVDAFAQLNAPLFMTRETDEPLFGERGAYTPYLQLGIGLGF